MRFQLFFLAYAFLTAVAAGGNPNEVLSPVLTRLEQTFRTDAANASDIVDIMQPQVAAVTGPFSDPDYDPRHNHWFIAEILSSMLEALKEEESPRRDRIIWAGMTSLLGLIEPYAMKLDMEGRASAGQQWVPKSQRPVLLSHANNALDSLLDLLVTHTHRLNKAYFEEKREEFDKMATRFAAGQQIGRADFFTLSNATHNWDSHSVAYEVLAELNDGPSDKRPGLKRLGLFLLVSILDRWLPGDKTPELESYFSSVLTNEGRSLVERAVASYGLSLLSRSENQYLTTTNQILNRLLRHGELFHPYADLCRRSLNGMAKHRLEQNPDLSSGLADIFEAFKTEESSPIGYFHFLMLPQVSRACATAILTHSTEPKARGKGW